MSRYLPLIFTFFALFAEAEVYTWVNEYGVRVYGDEPPKHAKKAQLPNIQSLPDVKAPGTEASSVIKQAKKNGFSGYEQFELLTPEQEQIIHFSEAGQVSVQLQLYPPLQINHQVTLYLNNKPVETKAALEFQLDQLSRGSYLIQAQVKHQGRLLISTPKRRIHVQRPSILNRPRT